jgi:hypothetical protein
MSTKSSISVRRSCEALANLTEPASAVTWRNLAISNYLENPVRRAVLELAVKHPAILHSTIQANLLHLKVRQPNPDRKKLNQLATRHEEQTIAHVNKELVSGEGQVSDAMLYAVLTLAVHGIADENVPDRPYPLSPLATAQQFHIYGCMSIREVHLKGLYALAEKKGGISTVVTPGVADALEVGDIFLSTRLGRPPDFHWRHSDESLVKSGKHCPDAIARIYSEQLGSAFDQMDILDLGVVSIITSMCEATIALDHLQRDTRGAPTLASLTRSRNGIQHRLLSLPPKNTLTSNEEVVAELLRIALLIYSDIVLFPTPPQTGVRTRYAASLILPLTLVRQELWSSHEAFLTWVMTLGGISAHRTNLRRFFVDPLRDHGQVLTHRHCGDLMTGFLWWAPVCNPPAQDLWREVREPELDTGHTLTKITLANATEPYGTITNTRSITEITPPATPD